MSTACGAATAATTPFEVRAIKLKTECSAALTKWNLASEEVLKALKVYNLAKEKFAGASVSEEELDSATSFYEAIANIGKDDGSELSLPFNYTLTTINSLFSPVTINFFRTRNAHKKAIKNFKLAIESLNSANAAYNTHVTVEIQL